MSTSILHALDIGENRIRCFSAIADVTSTGKKLKIAGFSENENSAMINGNITDLEKFKEILRKTINECESESSLTIDELIVGVGGGDLLSIYTDKKTQVNESSKKITQHDIDELLKFAVQSELPRDYGVINNYFINFQIDDKKNIKNPKDQLGNELIGDIHLLAVNKNFRDTISSTISELGKSVTLYISENEASFYSMEDPKEKVFATIDIGYKNTNISIFDKSTLVFRSSFDLGGYFLQADISRVINLSKKEASRVMDEICSRVKSGSDLTDQYISVVNLKEKKQKVPLEIVLQIVEARMEEIAKKAVSEIAKSGYYKSDNNDKMLEDGIILLGGSTNLINFKKVFMKQVELKAEIKTVKNVFDFDSLIGKPEYNIVFGLFFAALEKTERKSGVIRGEKSNISILRSLLNYIEKLF